MILALLGCGAPTPAPEPTPTPDPATACVERTFYADLDGDGYGGPFDSMRGCTPREGFVDNVDDCDDRQRSVSPDAEEICDEIDNDCDGVIDDDAAIDCNPDNVCDLENTFAFGFSCAYVFDHCTDGQLYEVDCETLAFQGIITSSCNCYRNGSSAGFFGSDDICSSTTWAEVLAIVNERCEWEIVEPGL